MCPGTAAAAAVADAAAAQATAGIMGEEDIAGSESWPGGQLQKMLRIFSGVLQRRGVISYYIKRTGTAAGFLLRYAMVQLLFLRSVLPGYFSALIR